MLKVGQRCRLVNCLRPQNNGLEVIVMAPKGPVIFRQPSGKRARKFAYRVDRELLKWDGKSRSTTVPEQNLEPIDDLCPRAETEREEILDAD